MSKVTPEELASRLFGGGDRPLLLDVRHRAGYDAWHVPDSENVDVYDELDEDPAAAKARLSTLPTGRDVVTICTVGEVSKRATELLSELGYDAATLVDGMQGWSRVHLAAPVPVAVDGTLLQVARPGKGCLSYVLVSDGEAAVFDPSHYPEEYEARVEDHDAALVGVFDTHAHADHVSGGRHLAARNDVPYHLHPADATDLAATPIEDGDALAVGSVQVDVLDTPGHSPGGVTYAVGDEALLTGDTLFHDSVGRVELGVEAGLEDADVEGNAAALYESLQRLLDRPDDALVLPAHDPGSPVPPVTATLSAVRKRNADLHRDRDAFLRELASDVPDHPPNFERVKRANVGRESVAPDEVADLELGPNNCAAE